MREEVLSRRLRGVEGHGEDLNIALMTEGQDPSKKNANAMRGLRNMMLTDLPADVSYSAIEGFSTSF